MKVKLEERYFKQEELGASERPYQALAKTLQETFTLTSVFDAGCRDAKLLKALNNLNLNLQLSGCDYFQWAVDSAEQEVRNLVFQHDLRDKLDIDNKYDLVVAADVLYAGMDGLFARTLASHLPSRDEIDGQQPPDALLACPFRKDSPLYNFFGNAYRLGLVFKRLEDANGNAVHLEFVV